MKICTDSSPLLPHSKPIAASGLVLAVALLAIDRFAAQGHTRLSLSLKVASATSFVGAGALVLNTPAPESEEAKVALIGKVLGGELDLARVTRAEAEQGIGTLRVHVELARFRSSGPEADIAQQEAALALSYAEQLYAQRFGPRRHCSVKDNIAAPYQTYSELRGEWKWTCYTTTNGDQDDHFPGLRKQYNRWVEAIAPLKTFPKDVEGQPFPLMRRKISHPTHHNISSMDPVQVRRWGEELLGEWPVMHKVQQAYDSCDQPLRKMLLALLLSDLAIIDTQGQNETAKEIIEAVVKQFPEAFHMPQTCRDALELQGEEAEICDQIFQAWQEQIQVPPGT